MSAEPRKKSKSAEERAVIERQSTNAQRAYRLSRVAIPFFIVLGFGDLGGYWNLPFWILASGYAFCASAVVAHLYYSFSHSKAEHRQANGLNSAAGTKNSPSADTKKPVSISEKFDLPLTFTCEPRKQKSPFVDTNYSNPRLFVSGESLERLKIAMSLSIRDDAAGYYKDEKKFVLFWCEEEKMTPFPEDVPLERCAEIAMAWLEGAAEYPEEPNIEGSTKRGWLCYAESEDRKSKFGYCAFLTVRPYWLLITK